jgi:hypothetical protein
MAKGFSRRDNSIIVELIGDNDKEEQPCTVIFAPNVIRAVPISATP